METKRSARTRRAFSTRGPSEHNVLNGGEDADYFGGEGNANTLNGGAGDDVFEVAGNGNTLTIWGKISDDASKLDILDVYDTGVQTIGGAYP